MIKITGDTGFFTKNDTSIYSTGDVDVTIDNENESVEIRRPSGALIVFNTKYDKFLDPNNGDQPFASLDDLISYLKTTLY